MGEQLQSGVVVARGGQKDEERRRPERVAAGAPAYIADAVSRARARSGHTHLPYMARPLPYRASSRAVRRASPLTLSGGCRPSCPAPLPARHTPIFALSTTAPRSTGPAIPLPFRSVGPLSRRRAHHQTLVLPRTYRTSDSRAAPIGISKYLLAAQCCPRHTHRKLAQVSPGCRSSVICRRPANHRN